MLPDPKSIRGRGSGRTGSDGDLARLAQGAPVGADVALDELGVELCREEPLEVVHGGAKGERQHAPQRRV